jgi:branched-chain amino acid transport system ATP-binding protein
MIILRTESLTKQFGKLRAVDNVDFELETGEIHGIMGPNGAGKSTLFNLISGLLQPTKGDIWFRDQRITNWPHYKRARYIGICTQQPQVYGQLTVDENLQIAFHGRENGLLESLKQQERLTHIKNIEDLLKITNLIRKKDLEAKFLSFLEIRMLEIGMATLLNPEVLLLDEPTAGLSMAEVQSMHSFLERMRSVKNISIVIIEHDIAFIKKLCRKITVMHEGKIFTQGSPEEIEKNEDVKTIYYGK